MAVTPGVLQRLYEMAELIATGPDDELRAGVEGLADALNALVAAEPTEPTAAQISAAILAYDQYLAGTAKPTTHTRFEAVRRALRAAFNEGK